MYNTSNYHYGLVSYLSKKSVWILRSEISWVHNICFTSFNSLRLFEAFWQTQGTVLSQHNILWITLWILHNNGSIAHRRPFEVPQWNVLLKMKKNVHKYCSDCCSGAVLNEMNLETKLHCWLGLSKVSRLAPLVRILDSLIHLSVVGWIVQMFLFEKMATEDLFFPLHLTKAAWLCTEYRKSTSLSLLKPFWQKCI